MAEKNASQKESVRISRDDIAALGAGRLAALMLEAASGDEVLFKTIQTALADYHAERANKKKDRASGEDTPHMVGSSSVMLDLYANIRKVSVADDAPVLIMGESGTGKELAANAIHERSERSAGPFVIINCAALPPNLIASELFGHEKGSFTGAHQRKIGRIEAADGGTVFLDEIGDLPLDMQSHLLRFLQEKTIDRVGGKSPIKVDARVVAATNADLKTAMKEGRYREDLYYRLNVLRLDMPPLRARGEDVDLISMYFLRKFADELDRPVKGFRRDAQRVIRSYPWPGNVRELIASIRRAVVMAESDMITLADLGLPEDQVTRANLAVSSLEDIRNRAEADAIRQTLKLRHRNIKMAANDLKISRPTLYRLLEKHSIAARDEIEVEQVSE